MYKKFPTLKKSSKKDNHEEEKHKELSSSGNENKVESDEGFDTDKSETEKLDIKEKEEKNERKDSEKLKTVSETEKSEKDSSALESESGDYEAYDFSDSDSEKNNEKEINSNSDSENEHEKKKEKQIFKLPKKEHKKEKSEKSEKKEKKLEFDRDGNIFKSISHSIPSSIQHTSNLLRGKDNEKDKEKEKEREKKLEKEREREKDSDSDEEGVFSSITKITVGRFRSDDDKHQHRQAEENDHESKKLKNRKRHEEEHEVHKSSISLLSLKNPSPRVPATYSSISSSAPSVVGIQEREKQKEREKEIERREREIRQIELSLLERENILREKEREFQSIKNIKNQSFILSRDCVHCGKTNEEVFGFPDLTILSKQKSRTLTLTSYLRDEKEKEKEKKIEEYEHHKSKHKKKKDKEKKQKEKEKEKEKEKDKEKEEKEEKEIHLNLSNTKDKEIENEKENKENENENENESSKNKNVLERQISTLPELINVSQTIKSKLVSHSTRTLLSVPDTKNSKEIEEEEVGSSGGGRERESNKHKKKKRDRSKSPSIRGSNSNQSLSSSMKNITKEKELAVIRIQRFVRSWLYRKHFRVVVSQFSKSKESLSLRLRNKAIYEIITTERQYINSLKTAKKVYVDGIFQAIRKGELPIKDKHIRSLFGSFSVIYDLNEPILNQLEERYRLWPIKTTFGDIFIQIAPLFRVYTDYLCGYESNVEFFAKLKHKYPQFVTFLKKQEEQHNCHDLFSYLIMPVQRLPRYQLLLAGVLKHTPKEHIDYVSLQRSQDIVVSILQEIETKKGLIFNLNLLSELNNLFKPKILDLLLEPRTLLWAGSIHYLTSKTDQMDKNFLFVFNNFLIFSKKEKNTSKNFRNMMKLDASSPREREKNELYKFVEKAHWTFHVREYFSFPTLMIADNEEYENVPNGFFLIFPLHEGEEPKAILCSAISEEKKSEIFNSLKNYLI